ncbi:hypothetical protein [Actinoplanes siamensis]|uniref:Uncharacterized protein n=1 Tax=Actinoplanes siamensis TaxID=1223317 RepID=A0A919TPH9_9ACTN|nr:hypothetical protein [Actinoplanes siamensis]GIF09802.1 hypothetical protein Asi03nite_73400 [Actinoplanes siamensis]
MLLVQCDRRPEQVRRRWTVERLSAARSHPPEKIEHARLLKAQGDSLAVIAAKTGIPKTS